MKVRGANGILVDGRVRDLAELKSLQLPVYHATASQRHLSGFTNTNELDMVQGNVNCGKWS